MGKKKIQQVELITDPVARNVTYCKRKKGLLKKAMELSILCGQCIYLVIYDKQKEKVVKYQNTLDFSLDTVDKLLKGSFPKNEYFENHMDSDYLEVSASRIKTSWVREQKKKLKRMATITTEFEDYNSSSEDEGENMEVK